MKIFIDKNDNLKSARGGVYALGNFDGVHLGHKEIISKVIDSVFKTPNGKEVLQYMRSITIDAVSGPNISDIELRHLEGQRYLVALLVKRINHAMRLKQ